MSQKPSTINEYSWTGFMQTGATNWRVTRTRAMSFSICLIKDTSCDAFLEPFYFKLIFSFIRCTLFLFLAFSP